jgi:hypothetical protein
MYIETMSTSTDAVKLIERSKSRMMLGTGMSITIIMQTTAAGTIQSLVPPCVLDFGNTVASFAIR